MNLFVMWNLGNGDAIICNGLVRELAKMHPKVYVPCYVSNASSVSFMFSDLPNVIIEEIYSPSEIFTLQMHHESIGGHKILKLGMYSGEQHRQPETFDQTFYRQAKVDFSKRWDSFQLPETPEINYVFPTDKKSIAFICDSEERGFRIDDSKISNEHLKVRPWKAEKIFDFISLLHHANEIHCIDSAFLHLVESVPTKATLFYHLYARNAGEYHQAKKRKGWHILT